MCMCMNGWVCLRYAFLMMIVFVVGNFHSTMICNCQFYICFILFLLFFFGFLLLHHITSWYWTKKNNNNIHNKNNPISNVFKPIPLGIFCMKNNRIQHDHSVLCLCSLLLLLLFILNICWCCPSLSISYIRMNSTINICGNMQNGLWFRHTNQRHRIYQQ